MTDDVKLQLQAQIKEQGERVRKLKLEKADTTQVSFFYFKNMFRYLEIHFPFLYLNVVS